MPLVRSLVATAACAVAATALSAFARSLVGAAPTGGPRLDQAVAAVAVVAGALAAAVLTAGCLLLTAAALARLVGRSSHRIDAAAARLTPAVLRRAVAVTVGASLGLTATAPIATAAEIDLGWEVTTSSTARPDAAGSTQTPVLPAAFGTGRAGPEPGGAPQPTVTPPPAGTGSVPPGSGPTAPPGGQTQVTVVVAPGDSLWRIAERHLGDNPSDREIVRAWPRWYAANESVIGADPDVIRPGQRLVVPAEHAAAVGEQP